MARIISIVNHKGGVGKTTTCVNAGAGLTLLGKKVLLIDLDPQANLTLHLALSPADAGNIYGALRGDCPLPVIRTPLGMDAVPSSIDLSAAETEFSAEPGREYLLRQLLAPLAPDYDFILIDCPPSLGLLTLNALSASTEMLIPVEPATFAIAGMTRLFAIARKVRTRLNPALTRHKLLITKIDSRKTIHRDMSDALKETYPGNLLDARIRSNVALEEAQARATHIFDYNPRSPGAEDYIALCRELLQSPPLPEEPGEKK
jgi:chromosome partitioning protein